MQKAIKKGILDTKNAEDLLELFDEESAEHSPCYAYDILEQDLSNKSHE
jgi:hypothetical protein